MVKGIDISAWQEPKYINYDKLAKEIDFAILRIAYTGWSDAKTQYIDKHFYTHYNELTKRGVKLGVYLFGVAMNTTTAEKEANFVLEQIKRNNLILEYGVWYDTENSGAMSGVKNGHQFLNKTQLTNVIDKFCSTIENAGYYCGIYASESWFTTKTDYNGILKKYDRWVANWSNEPKISYGIWQDSSTGKLKGYSGNLDTNVAKKDYPAIYKQMHPDKVVEPKKTRYFVYGFTEDKNKYPELEKVEVK